MTWHIQNSTPSTSSQEQEAAFSVTSYLDTIQSARARSNPTHVTSCSPDKQTDTCRTFPYGTMWQPSTVIPGADQLTFFAEDSPAKTSVRQVKEQELPANVRDYGRNMRDSLARCGLDLSLPKTHLCCALGDLELSSKTWPRWGIMLDGELSELGLSVRRTSATGCGSWPTPQSRDWKGPQGRAYKGISHDLPSRVMWPTPAARDAKGGNSREHCEKGLKNGNRGHMDQLYNSIMYPDLRNGKEFLLRETAKVTTKKLENSMPDQSCPGTQTQQKGQLNPSWVEWLMGWPIGWTELKPLVTDKFRNVQQWHSTFSQKD